MGKTKSAWVGFGLFLGALGAASCSSKTENSNGSSSRHYPLVKPPVEAAAPVAFGGTASHTEAQTRASGIGHGIPMGLSASDIDQRFFGAGPTDIYQILGAVDNLINGIDTALSSSDCVTQAPVGYTINPWGESVAMYAQCYETSGSGVDGLLQWALVDGTFYLWSSGGVEWIGVVATPTLPPTDAGTGAPDDAGDAGDGGILFYADLPPATSYAVHVWIGIGMDNAPGQGQPGCGAAWDSCSYGVIEVNSDPNAASFEMSVAGLAMGYCGAQLKSDGINIYVEGSIDMGSTCVPTATLCVSAADGVTPATCSAAEQAFTLPALGRTLTAGSDTPPLDETSYGASAYPGDAGDTIVLNGTTSDDIYFGPSSATAGVGLFVGTPTGAPASSGGGPADGG